MSKDKDGGKAFPRTLHHGQGNNGMSMRQYYKAAVLTGLISALSTNVKPSAIMDLINATGELADAMIAEDEEHSQ